MRGCQACKGMRHEGTSFCMLLILMPFQVDADVLIVNPEDNCTALDYARAENKTKCHEHDEICAAHHDEICAVHPR